jgi:threonine/homoserine efflux transporter RhtA
MSVVPVVARIVARYVAGALVAAGWFMPEVGEQIAMDPDVLMFLGIAITGMVEGFYYAARRLGWST